MIRRAALRGYLLEETLAWLLRHSGYRLLVSEEQDPAELVGEGSSTLRVRGRGALHQVDVLGEFAFTPAFSLPVRLFLEAKYYATPCRLEVVRNAHGVIQDVNEHFVSTASSRPRRRYQYSYALFSANGFTAEAQQYALAHQISMVDLSGESFGWLRDSITATSHALYAAALDHQVSHFPIAWMRTHLRRLLGTGAPQLLPDVTTAPIGFMTDAKSLLSQFTAGLEAHNSTELLLGFPAAPFVLPLATEDKQQFLSYAKNHPSHAVRIRRTGQGEQAEWTLSPAAGKDGYRLTFKLPDRIEAWIEDVEESKRKRTHQVKEDFLSRITVYRMNGAGVQSYQLYYEPQQLHRNRPDGEQDTLL